MRLVPFALIALLAGTAASGAYTVDNWHLMRTHPVDQFDQPSSDAAALLPPVIRTGTGQVAGMSGSAALYASVVGGPVTNAGSAGDIERVVPLTDWRGQRVRLSLRLKTEGTISSSIQASIGLGVPMGKRIGGAVINARGQNGKQDGWQLCQFVRDVPANGNAFVIDLHLYGRGTLWIDKLVLAADTAAPGQQGCRSDEGGSIRTIATKGEIPLGAFDTIAGP